MYTYTIYMYQIYRVLDQEFESYMMGIGRCVIAWGQAADRNSQEAIEYCKVLQEI